MEKFQKWAFYGWISEDDRPLNWGDKYLYSENIDVTSDPRVIQLSNKLELEQSILNKARQIVTVVNDDSSQTAKEVVFCDGGLIYSIWEPSPVYNNSGLWSLRYPCFTLWDTFYFINSWGATAPFELNSVTLTDAVSASWSPSLDILSWGAFTLSDNNNYKTSSVLTVWLRAYIALWDNIDVLKWDTWAVTNFSWVWEEIRGLSYWGWTIKIITETGKLHLWDWVTEWPIETIELKMRIQNTYEVWGVIYVVPWFKSNDRGLYYLNWYALERVFDERFSKEADKRKFNIEDGNQTITNDRNNLYLVDNDNGEYRVAFFWKESQELPNAYTYPNVFISTGARPFDISCLHYSQWILYVCWTDDWVHWIDTISVSNKNTSGYLETNPEEYDTGIYRKGAKHLKLRVEDVDADHTITVKESRDWGAYTTLGAYTSQPLDNVIRVHLNWDFREHKLKFELTSNDSTSPKIYYWYEYAYEIKDI